MKISPLKAEMLLDPDKTRIKVRKVLKRWRGSKGGMIGNAADELEVSRATLQRLIHEDDGKGGLLEFVRENDVRPQWLSGDKR